MEQRLSLVTLGVGDLEIARTFYHNLGWKEGPGSSDEVAFFQLNDMILTCGNASHWPKTARSKTVAAGVG